MRESGVTDKAIIILTQSRWPLLAASWSGTWGRIFNESDDQEILNECFQYHSRNSVSNLRAGFSFQQYFNTFRVILNAGILEKDAGRQIITQKKVGVNLSCKSFMNILHEVV